MSISNEIPIYEDFFSVSIIKSSADDMVEIQGTLHQFFYVLMLFNKICTSSAMCTAYQDPSYSRTDGEIPPILGIQLNNFLLPETIS